MNGNNIYVSMFASMYWLELVNNGVLPFLAIFGANVHYYCAAHVYYYHVTLYAIIVHRCNLFHFDSSKVNLKTIPMVNFSRINLLCRVMDLKVAVLS